MIKLKETIRDLDAETYESVEKKLIKTKARNFLYVLQAYREDRIEEIEIQNTLEISSSAFYTLKSRLYERIQQELTMSLDPLNKDVFAELARVHEVCYSCPNHIAIAFLHKLETKLLTYDMHGELLVVYSALKKLHYNTDKYFHYSQLHNRHVAYWLSLEKAEDLLSDFNLLLEEYDFSRSGDVISRLKFLRRQIENHSMLKASRQLEIIKTIMDAQLFLFCNTAFQEHTDVEDQLKDALAQIHQISHSSRQKKWEIVIYYLLFEYYNKTVQIVKANEYYEKANRFRANLLLYSNVALVSKFLVSEIEFLSTTDQIQRLDAEAAETSGSDNIYSRVHLGISKAMSFYFKNEIKKATAVLNGLLSLFPKKENFHIVMEIKFTLAFFYLRMEDPGMSESLITSIYRKIKAEKLTQYLNALDLIKFFNTFYNNRSSVENKKRQEALFLFISRNTGEHTLLKHLYQELRDQYLKPHNGNRKNEV